MKDITVIKQELEAIREDISSITDGTDDVLAGWVEALEWVLSNEEVSA
jgi:hypothetical protein